MFLVNMFIFVQRHAEKKLRCILIPVFSRYFTFLCYQDERKDLTHMKVYGIDVDAADEIHIFNPYKEFEHLIGDSRI